jgi:hypothetical protein
MIQGTAIQEKMMGSKQRFYKFASSGVVAIERGYQCWGVLLHADATDITSITENPNIAGAAQAAITNKTFEASTDLLGNDFILFDIPVTSFTISAGQVYYFIEPILGYQELRPIIVSASVENAAPTKVILTFDRNLNSNYVPAITAFTLSGGKTATKVEISGKTVTITADGAYANGNTITIGYTKPVSNYLREFYTGGGVATFTGQSVTNNIS